MLECISCRYGRTFALLLLFTLTKCDSFFNEMEGEGVSFEFFYPCYASDITLQYGNRIPFYRPSEPLTLTVDQTGRFKVQTSSSSCSLHLQIDPVMRSDAGTYILLANDNNYIERFGLRVDFSPGKPQCKSRGKHITGDWVELKCTASVGSLVGQILCYQDGTLMPPLRAPFETWRILEQTILVQHNRHHVFCCSTLVIENKGQCECNDFVWDPLSEKDINMTNPCPTTTPVPIITTLPTDQTWEDLPSKSPATTSLQISRPNVMNGFIFNELGLTEHYLVPWYSLLIASITVVIILVIILILVRYRKQIALVLCGYSMNRQTSKSDVPSKENVTVYFEPAVKDLVAKEENKKKKKKKKIKRKSETEII